MTISFSSFVVIVVAITTATLSSPSTLEITDDESDWHNHNEPIILRLEKQQGEEDEAADGSSNIDENHHNLDIETQVGWKGGDSLNRYRHWQQQQLCDKRHEENIASITQNNDSHLQSKAVIERFSHVIATEFHKRWPSMKLRLPTYFNSFPIEKYLPWLSLKKNRVGDKDDIMISEDFTFDHSKKPMDDDDGRMHYRSHIYPRRRGVGAWCPQVDDDTIISNNLRNSIKILSSIEQVDNGNIDVVDKSLTVPYRSSPRVDERLTESTLIANDDRLDEVDDVQPGMVMFVFPKEESDGGIVIVGKDDRHEDSQPTTANCIVPKKKLHDSCRDNMEIEDESKTTSSVTQCIKDLEQQYDNDPRIVQYVLIRREPLELGMVNEHSHDFAYQPVALSIGQGEDIVPPCMVINDNADSGRSSDSNSEHPPLQAINKEIETLNESPNSKQSSSHNLIGDVSDGDSVDQQVSYRWYSWVTQISQLLHIDRRGSTMINIIHDGNNGRRLLDKSANNKLQTRIPYQSSLYDKDGKHPFAGGSHGEIWKARRRCPIILEEKQDGDVFVNEDDSKFYNSIHKNQSCDASRDLIVKRLKIELGYPVLEAGLREIYFGELLAREAEASGLFTTYVDHFFREGHRKRVELWIVFENAGSSLRSFLYTPIETNGYLLYQHSAFWRKLRLGMSREQREKDESLVIFYPNTNQYTKRASPAGRELLREVLRQLIASVEFLHTRGIVHRDIKPSNIMCKTTPATVDGLVPTKIETVRCLLGDFSSAWDEFSSRNLYADGPSLKEQTNEYAPPEVLVQGISSWAPFCLERPSSYDLWSIGVVILELLLGTPNIFTVDQRTTVLLTNGLRKEGASSLDIKRALYLAALSQFCIYVPTESDEMNWPWRRGDPMFHVNVVKQKCTLKDFHNALRARDPLGIGFDDDANNLLHLVWRLLAWNPMERLSASEALQHAYFKAQSNQYGSYPSEVVVSSVHNALEHQTLDPRLDMSSEEIVTQFICPRCGRIFSDHNSCQHHARSRRHAKFCTYDRSHLPPCLNAHSMLPTHSTSGYCDVQGRRPTIEDFHTVHLNASHEFYGIFDGHLGNLASKYASSLFHHRIELSLANIDAHIRDSPSKKWRDDVRIQIDKSFEDLHNGIVKAVLSSPGGIMNKSGTTATILYITELAVIIANVGDSRAIMSQWFADNDGGERIASMQLTVDHIASSDEEKRQVYERGGFISKSGGIDRVMGILAVSRSLGDMELASVLSRTPHVLALTKNEVYLRCREKQMYALRLPCFIILASDGLWDVIDNQDAIDLAWQVIQENDNDTAYQKAAEVLVHEAYVRGSSDNIGVCVVAINVVEH